MLENTDIIQLNKLSKSKLIKLLEFIDNSLNFSVEEPFCNLINRLAPFLPNDMVPCAYVEVENKSLKNLKRVLNISYP